MKQICFILGFSDLPRDFRRINQQKIKEFFKPTKIFKVKKKFFKKPLQ